jgi:hypothetical protein
MPNVTRLIICSHETILSGHICGTAHKIIHHEIIISMGQNEFEINRLPGVLRAKSRFFIRNCDTESKNRIAQNAVRSVIMQLLHFYHEYDDENMTEGKDRGGKAIRDRNRSLIAHVNLG